MTLIGSLIKSGIALNQKLTTENKSAKEEQEGQLIRLITRARDTAFGKYYGFESMLSSSDPIGTFQKEVPIHNYEEINERWWSRQQRFPNITWPGQPNYFALSSGTTGKSSKRIPITEEFLQSIRDVGTSLVRSLPNFDFPDTLFESEILMLSSSANLDKHKRGHYEGEISGINVSNFPGWYDFFYRPGKEIASIDDWDERIKRIVEEAPKWQIGAIAGIPSWVLIMLQEIVRRHGLKDIHEIWPNFQVFASGGVAFETYRKDFEEISGRSLTIMDTYLASEGFFSYTSRPDTMSMQLALSHGYFYEFVPFDSRGVDEQGELLSDPTVFTIDQVKADEDYILLVTTCAGTWRYMIGDTIQFTGLDPFEIKLTGRTKFFLNVVGSQLSEEKMDAGIVAAAADHGITINEYSVSALQSKSGDYYHQWVVITDDKLNESDFTKTLDNRLKELNKNYAVARSKALKDVKVKVASKEAYYSYLEKNKKIGGQVKTPKVMSQEKMHEFLKSIG